MENNLTFNLEKIQFKQSQVSFYGHIWSKHSISPDPKKIQALKHMKFPPDKETMRSFLGMINYLNRYSALSTHLAAPLSALTHQTTEPGRVHQENFKKMEISNMKALPYFNANAETTLQMDASKKGPRASLIQKGKDIPVTDTFITDTLSQATPMNPGDYIQLPIRTANLITTHTLMSVQPQNSLSNKLD